MVAALPDTSTDLHRPAWFVEVIGLIIYAAVFGITLPTANEMDHKIT